MNIYEKVQKIKVELLDCKLKKSGKNKFAGFEYYELGDIMPDIIRLCDKHKVCTAIDFSADSARLFAFDSEQSARPVPDTILVNTPTVALEIKGSNAVQALGGMQTYMRRYLYMAMFDICENDTFDAVSGKTEKAKNQKPYAKKESASEDKKYCCSDCGSEFKGFTHNDKTYTAGQAYHMSEKKSEDGKARCKACREKLSKEEE
jgi:DNA-directed RNA polymerase subunit RPC12/RpoP